MKPVIILFLSLLAISASGQNKLGYDNFNQLTPLNGTDYVLATVVHVGKGFSMRTTSHLLFINTVNGQAKKIELPEDASIRGIEQVKLDTLHINKVIVAANTVNLDNSKYINWSDPTQIFVLSTDGQEKVQVTEDRFFARTWLVHRETGVIVITGHYDSNNNGKYDTGDKSEILVYDLKAMKLVSRI